MVFYLTGTGNCLYVAKQLEENSFGTAIRESSRWRLPCGSRMGGYAMFYEITLGESAWDSGIYKEQAGFSCHRNPPPSISGILRWNGKLEPQSRRSRRTEPTTVTCGGR